MITQKMLDAWPNCAIKGCMNKCCLALKSKYCWPHTPGTAKEAKKTLIETEFNNEYAKGTYMSKVRKNSLSGGETFGKLTVIEYAHTKTNGKHAERVMRCRCECGKFVEVRTSNLRSGNTVSCGCYHKARTTSSNQQRKLMRDEDLSHGQA